MLLAFLGAACESSYPSFTTSKTDFPDGVYSLIQIVQDKTSSTHSTLKTKGLNYENGRLSVKTDRVAPTQKEYIASTQRAFEKGGQAFKLHPEAFKRERAVVWIPPRMSAFISPKNGTNEIATRRDSRGERN
jgi:hypothetical protein